MANMIPISTVTVGSGGITNIEFNNISQGYTDLLLVISGRSDAATTSTQIGAYLNGGSYPQSASTNRNLISNGSSASSTTNSNYLVFGDVPGTSATSNTFNNCSIYMPNYISSNYKSFSTDSVTENNGTTATAGLYAGLYSSSSSISSIKINLGSGNFAQYSSATLYGIRKY